MIEKMKKITMLVYHSSKTRFLTNLQELGVVHLETNPVAHSENIVKTKDFLNRLSRAYKTLSSYKHSTSTFAPKEDIGSNIVSLLNHFEDDKNVLDTAISEKEMLKKDHATALPFGNFDKTKIAALAEKGISTKIYSCTKSAYAKIDLSKCINEIIYTDKALVYFAVFYTSPDQIAEITAAEEKMPEKNVSQILDKSRALDFEVNEIENRMKYYAQFIDLIEAEGHKYTNALSYDFANASMAPEVDGKIFIIKGFVPHKLASNVKELLDKEDCAYILEDPSAEDAVPIRLKNNPFATLFEPIGQLFSLPDYKEIDTVPFFAPFFALFFGLCLGDFGYGIVMIIAVIIALFMVKNKGFRKILYLGLVLGIFTVIGGIMLNSFFGSSIAEKTASGEVVSKIGAFDSLKSFVTFSDTSDRTGPMIFAILLGIVQVFFGQILNAVNRVKNLGIQGLFQPIGTNLIMIGGVMIVMVWMYKATPDNPFTNFHVGPIPVGEFLSSFGYPPAQIGTVLAAMGVICILLFNNIGNMSVFLRPLAGLWELYNVLTGILGDLLSYIRIFALGLAGGLLGAAFNGIALQLAAVPYAGILLMLLVMIVGHTLNFLLSALSAFVHPLRLTFVEFYKAVGFSGGGKPYTPFKNRTVQK